MKVFELIIAPSNPNLRPKFGEIDYKNNKLPTIKPNCCNKLCSKLTNFGFLNYFIANASVLISSNEMKKMFTMSKIAT
jgi:hypothetical protein